MGKKEIDPRMLQGVLLEQLDGWSCHLLHRSGVGGAGCVCVCADLGDAIDQELRVGHSDFEMPLNVPVAISTRQLDV